MISNLRISLVELIVWALFAMAGLTWTVARVFDGLERAWDWWRYDRVTPLFEDEDDRPGWISPDCRAGDHSDCEGCWCDCGHDLLPLPPERTWEQMTSHQLPVMHPRSAEHPCDGCKSEPVWPTHEFRVVSSGNLGPRYERRAPWWEAEHRAAYESLGFDYPSGLMARVRELVP